MVKFVWLDVPGGGQVPVNPDQVQYLRQTRDGGTALVFGALAGALHELAVSGDGESITKALEAAAAAGMSAKVTPPASPARPRPDGPKSPRRKGGS